MVKVPNGRYFNGLLKFQIFFGVLEIPDIFWGESRVDARPEPTYEEMRVRSPGGGGGTLIFSYIGLHRLGPIWGSKS